LKLTQAAVRRLLIEGIPPNKSEHFVWDSGLKGFGVRFRRGAKPTYVFQYRIHGKQRRLTVDDVDALDVADARRLAGTHHANVKLHIDPAQEKADRLAAAKAAKMPAEQTFGQAVQKHLRARSDEWRPATKSENERFLVTDAASLHKLPLSKIERGDVAGLLTELLERLREDGKNGTVTCNRARTALSACFKWCVQQGWRATNPCVGTFVHKEVSRERWLKDWEIVKVWNALPQSDFGAVMKMLILTGQRGREIAGLRWDEVKDGKIALPGSRTKNGVSSGVNFS
jgi:Arm DNA-binding domain